MSAKLSSLVEATNDPYLLMYVIYNLGRGVPPRACFVSNMKSIKRSCEQRLMGRPAASPDLRKEMTNELIQRRQELIQDLQAQLQIQLQERQLTATLFQQSSLEVFVRKTLRENPGTLRDKLRAPDPLARLLTLRTIARRRLPLEAEVIDLLEDPNPVVGQVARETLVGLARGTDFGPLPGSVGPRRQKAVQKWKDWLALQKAAAGDSPAPGEAVAVKPPVRFDPGLAMRNILAPQETVLRTGELAVQQLAEELLAAKGSRQDEVLERLKLSKGTVYTDALALAIPKLAGPMQPRARAALAERLTRMKAATLKDKLQDEDAEVRRAAARACALKEAKEQVPDLIPLLLDPERSVAAAAHASLKQLTGRDFGPKADAGAGERTLALLAWRDWWKTQKTPGN